MNMKITPRLRQHLIVALVDGSIGMKEMGYSLLSVEGVPATEQEKEDWNEYIALDDEMRDEIRLGLHSGYIDIDRLFGFLNSNIQ